MISRTAPYFHVGSHAALDEVLNFYHFVDKTADPDLEGLDAPSPHDSGARSDLKAFFDSISDGTFDRTIPDRVPSGLPLGGN